MKPSLKIAAAITAVTLALTPTANAQTNDELDWTGGRPLPPGTQVPFEPGYASQWRMYDVVRFGDPNFNDYKVPGVRVMGKFDQNSILCIMNAKGGLGGCFVDGQPVTDVAWGRAGKIVTVDPVVKAFAPILNFFIRMELYMSSGNGSSLSSR